MISVVVPAYNAERTIEDCLKSLLDQTVPSTDYEIVVVNDGSVDRTEELVRQFPVKYFYQENQGPARARNFGVEKASGDVILFTDSDCVAERNWIELMTRPLADAEISAVKGAYLTKQRSLAAQFAQIEFEERYDLLKGHTFIDFVDSYSAAFRKKVFLEAGGFDTSFPKANNEDTELSYKLATLGCKMIFVPQAVVYHRHPDSIWKYFKLKIGRGYWRMVVYRRFPEKMMKDSYTPQSMKFQILLAFLLCCCLVLFVLSVKIATAMFITVAVLFLLSSISFWKRAFSKGVITGILAPAFLLLRAVALGTGALWGVLRWRSL